MKTIDLMFTINEEEEVFVELDYEPIPNDPDNSKIKAQLLKRAIDRLTDFGIEDVVFQGWYSVEQAEMMGLDTY